MAKQFCSKIVGHVKYNWMIYSIIWSIVIDSTPTQTCEYHYFALHCYQLLLHLIWKLIFLGNFRTINKIIISTKINGRHNHVYHHRCVIWLRFTYKQCLDWIADWFTSLCSLLNYVWQDGTSATLWEAPAAALGRPYTTLKTTQI